MMSHSLLHIKGKTAVDGVLKSVTVSVNKTLGTIDGVYIDQEPPEKSGEMIDSGDGILLPGDVNAHSHPEQSLYVDIVDPEWDLATWCRNTIYRYSTQMTPRLIYLACARAFSRMLLYGTTSVVVSFYCHNGRGNELDEAVIQAANDTGIRLYFGRMNYDIILDTAYPEKQQSQRSYYETPEAAERYFRELMQHESPLVTVAPAIHSFHANTLEAIKHGIRLSHETGRLLQFHLSEDMGDVDLCLQNYNLRPVEVLARLKEDGDVPSLEHLLLSDCIWLTDGEKDLIAKHGMKVVLNPRMNDRVKAGRADLNSYLERGITVWLGTDGEASNDDLSLVHEREYLRAINPGVPSGLYEKVSQTPFSFGNVQAGLLKVGFAADFKIIKGDKTETVYVGGRCVVDGGKLLTMDVPADIEIPLADCFPTGGTQCEKNT